MNRTKLHKWRFLLPLLIVAVILFGQMEETVAWLQVRDNLANTFFAPVIDVEIIETFDNEKTKKNVYIQNNSNTDVYVRVKLIAQRKVTNDTVEEIVYSEGISNSYSGTDFSITWGDSKNWTYSTDGCFYYTVPIKAGSQTENLIDTCVMAEGVEPLSLHIYAQAIQPSDVEEAWEGVNIENGTLIPTTG